MDSDSQHHDTTPRANRSRWILAGFLAVAAFFLWTEHRAHVLGILPYLIFLACPLMHFFHHGHHKHHGHGEQQDGKLPARPKGEEP